MNNLGTDSCSVIITRMCILYCNIPFKIIRNICTLYIIQYHLLVSPQNKIL